MGMQTDVQAKSLSASGEVYGARTRVRGLIITPGANAGSVTLKDGGSGGASVLVINTIANGEAFNAIIPANGVLFETDVYATLSNTSVTVFYG
jgi:hypothetical protein